MQDHPGLRFAFGLVETAGRTLPDGRRMCRPADGGRPRPGRADPPGRVLVRVERGWVAASGDFGWQHQRSAAE
jgi:hypothetical protein